MKRICLLTFILSACSSVVSEGEVAKSKKSYKYYDASGKWLLVRENKPIQNKIVTRVSIHKEQSMGKPFEKSVMVLQRGSVKTREGRVVVYRPFASEYTVWLEGKEYYSKMSLDSRSKSIVVDLRSPESKWSGREQFKIPKGKTFCFYNQLSECLIKSGLLNKAIRSSGKPLGFNLVWDSYPYLQDQLTGVGATPISLAHIVMETEKKNEFHFQIEVDGQTILYQFSKSLDFVRMFWVSQGISVLPPNEDLQVE